MTNYCCKICNYSTDRSNNYKIHIISKKHMNNMNNRLYTNNNNKVISNSFNMTKYDLICSNKTFANKKLANSNKVLLYSENINTHITENKLICENIKCEYCDSVFKTKKYVHNHYIKSCIKIPDKIKNRLIVKHNNNPRTKNKLALVVNTNYNSKIYNINNNISGNTINTTIDNSIDNSVTVNNKLKLNTFGNETLKHISDEKMNEIIKSDSSLMYLLCREISKIPENNNTFINTRKDLAFYLDEDETIKIDRIKQYIYKFCNKYMERMKQYILDNPEKFTQIGKNVFKDTYDIYFCIINKHNFDEMEQIEAEHEELIKKFVDDVKINLLNSNKVSKSYLDTIEKDFYKLT